jgi:hypothetical protein
MLTPLEKESRNCVSAEKGVDLEGSRGTFWGVLNAVLEYVDHHCEVDGSRVIYVLFGDGMDLKQRTFQLIQDEVAKAA